MSAGNSHDARSAASMFRPGWSGDGYYAAMRHDACGDGVTVFAPLLPIEEWLRELERAQVEHEEKCDA